MSRGTRHICHVTTAHPWYDTRIFERMCVGLSQRGYRVTLVAPIDAPRVERCVALVPSGLSGKAARALGMPLLLRQLARLEADIYHFHDPELLPWMALFRRLTGRRVIYDVHEYYPESVVDSNYFGWRPLSRLAGAVFGAIEPALGRSLDGVTGVTPGIVGRFTGGRARTATVRNVIATENLHEEPPSVQLPSSQTLVLGGVMDRNRLMPELIAALAILVRRWPGLTLLAIGVQEECVDGAEILTQARMRGVADRVVLHPYEPWPRFQAYLARSAVGLVLYRDRQNNRWGLPNRLFEFMAHGVPIVASDFPLLRQIVEECGCGILLHDNTPVSIAEAIETLLWDPATARALGMRGREAVLSQHNWSAEIAKLTALYDQL